jgi:archaetidylinositol phosphate synthase
VTLDHFRPHVKDIIHPFIAAAARAGLTPNSFTIAAFAVAAGSGAAYFMGSILWGTILVAVNAVFDAMDGALARMQNIQSSRGDFLDHVVDRYADIFIITGIFAGGFAPWPVGVLALTGVLMSSYLGTQAQAVGVGRYYGGLLGRADRLVMILIAGILDMVFPAHPLGLPFLGWLLVVFGVMGHFTAAQRFAYVWRRMK